jgi:hypothetical protein
MHNWFCITPTPVVGAPGGPCDFCHTRWRSQTALNRAGDGNRPNACGRRMTPSVRAGPVRPQDLGVHAGATGTTAELAELESGRSSRAPAPWWWLEARPSSGPLSW